MLDVQFAVQDVHPLDRSGRELQFAYHPSSRALRRAAFGRTFALTAIPIEQHLGVRYWWSCLLCGRPCRFLYHFEIGLVSPPKVVIGCRECLALTYASRARHRCADQDVIAAARGNAFARQRVERRAERLSARISTSRDLIALGCKRILQRVLL